jgi:ABC-type polysaccharide/polyol phosphate transport system ATPase subunit
MLADLQIANVSRTFTIRHNKSNSLKSDFIGIFSPRYREQTETLWAVRNVSFNVSPGEAFALIGRNGSGKSTLLKIIAGIYPPTEGRVQLPAGVRIGTMIELGVGFHPELTGKENIYLGASIHGLCRKEIQEIYGAVVEFSELENFMDTPIKNYSSGMHARLAFALAVNLNPDVLLVDEVLAVGDEPFQKKCKNQIDEFRAQGKTIIFVSHSTEDVKNICDRACVLEHGRTMFIGRAAEAVERYHQLLGK